jgi:putative phosphoesterase
MIVGIVSDTHGHVEYTRAAVRMLQGFEVAQVIHCGDIGSTEVVELFRAWPTHFVLGNVDSHAPSWRRFIEQAGQTFHGRFGSLEIEGRRIAFLHGDDARLLEETIAGGEYDLVCHGHTHVAKRHARGKTLVVNPGALYRAERHSIAIARLPELEVTHLGV